MALVQPCEECLALSRVQVAGDSLSLLAVVAFWPYAHPVAVFSGELGHAGVGVLALQLRLELVGLAAAGECANLHAPAAAGVDGLGSAVNIHPDARCAGLVNACGLGRGNGEIDHPAL